MNKEEQKLPSPEEVLHSHDGGIDRDEEGNRIHYPHNVISAMKEYAWLVVQYTLKRAAQEAIATDIQSFEFCNECMRGSEMTVDESSILSLEKSIKKELNL